MTKLVSLHAHGHAATTSVNRLARGRKEPLHAVDAAATVPAEESCLRTAFGSAGARLFAGHVADPSNPTRRHVVQLFVDGVALQICIADQYDDALAADGVGDGCYGFSFAVAADALADASLIEARLANLGTPVGPPVRLLDSAGESHGLPSSRGVRWIGGLRFCGWLEAGDHTPTVSALIDGATIAEVSATTWHQIGGRDDDAQAAQAFDLHLSARFADGRVRTVRIVDEAGQDLPGSPLTFVAFENGLERSLAALGHVDSERLRGELYDRLIPASLPMAQFASWRDRFAPAAVEVQAAPVAVIFTGHGDEEASIASLEAQNLEGWVAAALPGTTGAATFDPDELKSFLSEQPSDCDVAVFAPCGTMLEPDAVERLVAVLRDNPKALIVYADIAVSGSDGAVWPLFLPTFDYERMLEQGCGAYLFAARRDALERALVQHPASLFRLFNLIAGDPAAGHDTVMHLPMVLATLPQLDADDTAQALADATAAHLKQRGIEAEIEAATASVFPAVRVTRRLPQGKVSIVIPTRNRVGLLRRCLETIAPALVRTPAEIIVVDNDSSDPETLDYLAAIDGKIARVLRVPGVFNFSRLNNAAAAVASGDYLCLLNNDIEALDDCWLEEMLSRIAEPDVGAVGATLLWPTGIIQHAGVVLGPNLGAVHAFNDRMQDDCGYADMLSVARECSAVTAACLLTRKADYLTVGGMDELFFPVNFNDVDYCLKLRALGRRVVVTPHARLLHLESASRGSDQSPDRAGRMHRELRSLRARWLGPIVHDPYYNPSLSLDSIAFSALAWPPRDRAARLNQPMQPALIPLGM